jgi:hypothetical protein
MLDEMILNGDNEKVNNQDSLGLNLVKYRSL